jgi:lipoprotein-anchoring transpeptidase ErfK/SrfK
VAAGAWWIYTPDDSPSAVDGPLALAPLPELTSDRPEITPGPTLPSTVPEKGATPERATAPGSLGPTAKRAESLLAAGRQAIDRNELVAARTYLSEAFAQTVEPSQASLLRAELTRLGNETIFSPRIFPNDPLIERYVIQPGDSLGKIAKANKVSADLLAQINQIRDKNRIRAGQTIKVVKGPFQAIIDRQTHSLDVYLGTTFVKHFKVGLGADDSTPSGQWRVSVKLTNPTYYPPRGGQIITADDPENPLGERWIGLEGVGGEAAGQYRYGIHGTIEPDSIGRNVSLGCIRMYNEDVEALYTYLIEKHSIVEVRD